MPPLDWSIIRALLLNLVLPGCSVAIGILAIAFYCSKSEMIRAVAAAIGFLASLIVVNHLNQLVPLLAIKQIVVAQDPSLNDVAQSTRGNWELETGWYSLLSVTILVVVAEVVLDFARRRKGFWWFSACASLVIAATASAWVVPFEGSSIRSWVIALMAGVTLLNTLILRHFGHARLGYGMPLFIAIVWGGSSTALTVLSHSARFADLAMMLTCPFVAIGLMNLLGRQRLVNFYSGPAIFFPGLMLETSLNTYSDVPQASYALIAVAPGLLALGLLPKIRVWFEARPIAQLVSLTVPCAVAVGLAIRAELWK